MNKLDERFSSNMVNFLTVRRELVDGASLLSEVRDSQTCTNISLEIHCLLRDFVRRNLEKDSGLYREAMIRALQGLHKYMKDDLKCAGLSVNPSLVPSIARSIRVISSPSTRDFLSPNIMHVLTRLSENELHLQSIDSQSIGSVLTDLIFYFLRVGKVEFFDEEKKDLMFAYFFLLTMQHCLR